MDISSSYVDDLSVMENRRVLILEDDVVSGITLQLAMGAFASYKSAEVALYLGRRKEDQFLDNVPSTISQIYLATDTLDAASRSKYEQQFIEFLKTR
jgi:hypoxanthine-guanine phosphoribosyltransferase